MALNFTDDQIKKITNDIIGLPAVIQGHIDDKADLQLREADLQKEDEANKVFTDNFIGITTAYHSELQAINGSNRSEYTEAMIQAGPRRQNGHFPSSSPNLVPLLLPQNNGNPVTTEPDRELLRLPDVDIFLDLLIMGFADGATEDTLAEAYVAGQPVILNAGGFSNGQRVVIDQGGQSLIAVVTAAGPASGSCSNPIYTDSTSCTTNGGTWTPPAGAQSLTLNVLSNPAVVLGIGARVRNFHPGFTNNEREGISIPYAPEVLTYWEQQLTAKIAVWKPYVLTQQAALGDNDATGAEQGQNQTALTSVTDALDAINDFETAPATGAGVGKYGNTVLGPIIASVSQRTTELPDRVTEIITALGSVSQNPNFTYTGNGQYFNLFKWVDARINLAGGSLARQLQLNEGVVFFDNAIAVATAQLNDYNDTFLVKQFDGNGNGSEFVTLQDVTDLSPSDAVMVMDNDSAVFNRTIVAIVGNVVELDSAIGVNLTTSKLARLVKRL